MLIKQLAVKHPNTALLYGRLISFPHTDSMQTLYTLGREPSQQCSGGLVCPMCAPFEETVFDATGRNETFVAKIGPPGGPRGYQGITGEYT